MASLKSQKPAGTQAPSTKKEPVKAGTSFPTRVPLPSQAVANTAFPTSVPLPSQAVANTAFPTAAPAPAPASAAASKKVQPKLQEPRKKASPGGKAGPKN